MIEAPRAGWSAAIDMLTGVRPVEPWVVIVPVLVLLACLLAIGLILWYASRRRHRPMAARPVPGAEDAAPGGFGLIPLFRQADRKLYELVNGGANFRYRSPWFLCLGESQSGKSALMAAVASATNAGETATIGSSNDDCRWWFLDRGLILDVSGRLLLNRDGTRPPARGWRELLSQLQFYRPKRPIDGIIVTLPCDDLLDSSPRAIESLRAKAGVLHTLLDEVQRRLGIRPAVFIALTKADRLDGFQDFASALPAEMRSEMLGWSSPFNPDTPFAPEWVDEALAAMRRGTEDALLELLALKGDIAAPGRALQFPGRIETLRDNLVLVLGDIFRSTAYTDAAMLRGLWFTGETAPQSVAFARDLITGKVMPEFALSRPVGSLIRSTNRRVRIAQASLAALVVALTIGLVNDYRDFKEDIATVTTILTETIADIEMIGRRGDAGGELNGQATTHILDHMSRLRDSSLRYPFIPASLLSAITDDFEGSIRLAYEHIVLEGMRDRLDFLLRQYAEAASAPPPQDQPALLAPALEDAPEFDALRGFADRSAELAGLVRLYHSIPDNPKVETIGVLVSTLYGHELPQAFFVQSHIYEEPLRAVSLKRIAPAEYALAYAQRLDQLGQSLDSAIHVRSPVLRQARELSDLLSAVGSRQAAAHLDLAALARLRDAIARMDAVIASPAGLRLGAEAFESPAALDRALIVAADSGFIATPPIQALRERLTQGHKTLRRQLLTIEADGFGLLFSQPNKRAPIELSRGVKAVQADLDALLQSEFAKGYSSGRMRLPAALPPGTAVKWNYPRLDKALGLYFQWADFMRNRGRQTRSPGDQSIASVGTNQLVTNMMDLVAGAVSFDPVGAGYQGPAGEAAIAAETANLRDVSYEISSLIEAYADLGAVDAQLELSRLVEMQVARLMKGIEALAQSDQLYGGPDPDLSWWEGVEPPSPRAFGAADRIELAQYLNVQRERTALLARQYAKPVIDLTLAQKGVLTRFDLPLLSRWQRIMIQLDAYDRKVPTSSVAQIEHFITQTMTRLTRENCGGLLTARANEYVVADLFLAQRKRLEDALKGRCRQFQSVNAGQGVRGLIDRYRASLAGRFPFNGIAPKRVVQEVSPVEADAFFRQFNEAANRGLGDPMMLASVAGQQQQGQVRAFIDGLDRLRAFIAAGKVEAPGAKSPAYLVEIDFRVEREREIFGSHVIDWSLTIGDKTVTQRDSTRQLPWRFGDPVELRLRWARNAPTQPQGPRDAQSFLAVGEQTAVFRYDTGWSLLALIADRGAAAEAGTMPGNDATRLLTLVVPVAPNTAPGIDVAEARKMTMEIPEAKMFARIRLLTPAPDNRTVLPIPDLAVAVPVLAN